MPYVNAHKHQWSQFFLFPKPLDVGWNFFMTMPSVMRYFMPFALMPSLMNAFVSFSFLSSLASSPSSCQGDSVIWTTLLWHSSTHSSNPRCQWIDFACKSMYDYAIHKIPTAWGRSSIFWKSPRKNPVRNGGTPKQFGELPPSSRMNKDKSRGFSWTRYFHWSEKNEMKKSEVISCHDTAIPWNQPPTTPISSNRVGSSGRFWSQWSPTSEVKGFNLGSGRTKHHLKRGVWKRNYDVEQSKEARPFFTSTWHCNTLWNMKFNVVCDPSPSSPSSRLSDPSSPSLL